MMTFHEFEAAQAACAPGQVVMGAIRPDGKPVYAPIDEHATDEQVERLAFELVNDRSMNEAEEFFHRETRRLAIR